MTRQEKIDVLIEDRLTDWVFAQNTDSLEDMLAIGWKGYDDYSDQEIEEALGFLSEDQIADLLESRKRRIADRKRWDQEKLVASNPKI